MGSIKLIGKKKAEALIRTFDRIADSIFALSESISRLSASGTVPVREAGVLQTDTAVQPPGTKSDVLNKPVAGTNTVAETAPVSAKDETSGADPVKSGSAALTAVAAADTAGPQASELVPAGYFLNSFIKSSGMTILRLLDMPHAGSIFERIASVIGDNYDDIEPFLKALKYSASNKQPVSISTAKCSKQVKAKYENLGSVLFENAMLENYFFRQDRNIIHAKLSENPPVVNFITGHWMEIYIFNALQKMLDSYRKQYNCEIEIYGNLQISLPDGNNFELDILGFINAQPLWIECKSGIFQDSVTKYKNFGSRYHIPHQNSLMVVSGITDEQAAGISEIHGFNICTLRNFRNVITRILDRMCMNITVSTANETPSPVNILLDPVHFLTADSIKNEVERYGISITGSQVNSSDIAVVDTAGLLIGRNYILAKQILSTIRTSINTANHNGTLSLLDKSSYENGCACQIMMALNKSGMISNYSYKKVMRTIIFSAEPSSRLISFIEGRWFSHYVASLVNKFLLKKNPADFSIARNVELTRGDLSIVIDLAVKIGEQFTFIKTALRDYEKAALEISTLSENMKDAGNRLLLVCHDLTSEKIEKMTAQCSIYVVNCETFEQNMPVIFNMSSGDFRDHEQNDSERAEEAGQADVTPDREGSPETVKPETKAAEQKEEQTKFKIHAYEFSPDELELVFSSSGIATGGFDTYTKEMTDSDGCANVIYQNYDNIKNILTSIYVNAIRQNRSVLRINAENLPDPVTSALCNLCLTFKRKGWLSAYSYSGNKTKCITIQASNDPKLMNYISRGWLDHRIYSETHKHLISSVKSTGNQNFRIARNLKVTVDSHEITLTVMMHYPNGSASSGNIFVKTVFGNSEREAEELMLIGKALNVSRDYLILVTFGMDQITSRRISTIYGITVVTCGEYHTVLEKLTSSVETPETSQNEKEVSAAEEQIPVREKACDFSALEELFLGYRLINRAFMQHVTDVQLKLADCSELFDDDNLSVTLIDSYSTGMLMLDKLLCSPEDENEINCAITSLLEPCLDESDPASEIMADLKGFSSGRQFQLYRLFAALQEEKYLTMLNCDEKTGQIRISLKDKGRLGQYLKTGWYSHLCSRMIEEHIITLTEENGISNTQFKFGRNMKASCNNSEINISFVLKPQIGVAFFNFAENDFEKAARDLNIIKTQKNLMQNFAILVCDTEDGELCDRLSEKYQIEVLPFSEFEDYLDEYIAIEPADSDDEDFDGEEDPEFPDPDNSEEEDDETADEEENADSMRYLDYEDLMSRFGYCSHLANLINGRKFW